MLAVLSERQPNVAGASPAFAFPWGTVATSLLTFSRESKSRQCKSWQCDRAARR